MRTLYSSKSDVEQAMREFMIDFLEFFEDTSYGTVSASSFHGEWIDDQTYDFGLDPKELPDFYFEYEWETSCIWLFFDKETSKSVGKWNSIKKVPRPANMVDYFEFEEQCIAAMQMFLTCFAAWKIQPRNEARLNSPKKGATDE